MKSYPIIFNAAEVRATFEGRKTQARQPLRWQPGEDDGPFDVGDYSPIAIDRHGDEQPGPELFGAHAEDWSLPCPYGAPGGRLWVRETWAKRDGNLLYRASTSAAGDAQRLAYGIKWRHYTYMPRWASRITLEVLSVRVERVQDIIRLDIVDEGWPHDERQAEQVAMVRAGCDDANIDDAAIEWFADLWDSTNAKLGYSWDANPWVWVVEFSRLECAQ